ASPVPPLLLSPELPAPNDAAVSGVGSLAQLWVRTVGTLAILSLGVAVTLGVYHKFPWSPSAGAGAAASMRALPGAAAKPYAADSGAARAARLQALNNEAELRIANGLAPVSA